MLKVWGNGELARHDAGAGTTSDTPGARQARCALATPTHGLVVRLLYGSRNSCCDLLASFLLPPSALPPTTCRPCLQLEEQHQQPAAAVGQPAPVFLHGLGC